MAVTHRKNGIHPDVKIDDVMDLEHYFRDYVTDIANDEDYFPIIKVFNNLPLDEKRLFIIYLLCDNNATAVAHQLGASSWSVRTKILNIRKKLQQ